MSIKIKGVTITPETDLDDLSDAVYEALEAHCDDNRHPEGECPLCAFDTDTIWGDKTSGDFVGGLWGGWGKTASGKDAIERLVEAHKVVKSFVDTFATGDLRYDVTFDPYTETAGTDLVGKSVVISPKPALDPTLTPEQAGTILTGMAVHEAAHVRYGRATHEAVKRSFAGSPLKGLALKVSNVLDDVRIERRFVSDYPGYSGVFAPTIKYVADGSRVNGGDLNADPKRPFEFLVAATRYADHVIFNADDAENRDWWQSWAERASKYDEPKAHVAVVREAVQRLVEQQEEIDEDEPEPTGEPGGEQGDGEPGGEYGQPGGDGGNPVPSKGKGGGSIPSSESKLPEELSAGVDDAAEANDADTSITGHDAQAAVNDAASLTTNPSGVRGEIGYASRCQNRLADSYSGVPVSQVATAAIRNALLRSRSGHTGVERGMSRGRCDSASLHRIAYNDPRLFHRRSAPEPGLYNVWVMIDRSGSMQGYPTRQTIAVAKALASAVRYTPQMRLTVWGWTTSDKMAASFGAFRVWSNGEDVTKVEQVGNIPEGGTPDSATMEWAVDAIVKETRTGEQPVIFFLSDGQGDESGVREQVARGRKNGVKIVSVAIGYGVKKAEQERTFGERNYVPWAGSIEATAHPLAQVIGRLVAS